MHTPPPKGHHPPALEPSTQPGAGRIGPPPPSGSQPIAPRRRRLVRYVAPVATGLLCWLMIVTSAAPLTPRRATSSADPVFTPHTRTGSALVSSFVLDNQIDPSVVPESVVKAAAASWGLTYRFGGPPACGAGHSPAGVQVVCMMPITQPQCPSAGCWSFYFFAGGIVLSPILVGRPLSMVQEAICHEAGNALDLPEEEPTAPNCMAMSMNGHTNIPDSVRLGGPTG